MPRIPYPSPEDISAENVALLADLPDFNVFKMMARTGAAFGPFMALVNAYLNDGTLNPELRELAILRVGHNLSAQYEVWHHERVARELGMSEERIMAAGAPSPSPLLSDVENAAVAFADDVVENTLASQKSFDAVHAHLGDNQTTELLMIIGVYQMVCSFLETMDIEIETSSVPEGRLEHIKTGVNRTS